jgi:AraC-like DNA-binding protein
MTFFLHENSFATYDMCASEPHNHGDYELRYVCSGKTRQILQNETVALTEGDMFLLHPMEYHYQTKKGFSHDISQFSIRFSMKEPNKDSDPMAYKSYVMLSDFLISFRSANDKERTLLPLIRMIAEELSKKESGFFGYLQAMCRIFLTNFLRLVFPAVSSFFASEAIRYSGNMRNRLDHFFRYHYMDDVKLQDLADAIQVSTRQVSRILIKEFGENYVTHLMHTRIQQAKYQLDYTNKDIHQISSDCGFQSYNYFATCFKQVIGQTPTEYRKQIKAPKATPSKENS